MNMTGITHIHFLLHSRVVVTAIDHSNHPSVKEHFFKGEGGGVNCDFIFFILNSV